MNGNDVTRALHELFESQVINHGDYSVVYAQPFGPGTAFVMGYRHTPLELVLCPVELECLPHADGGEHRVTARPVGPVSSIDLSNVATIGDTGAGYLVNAVTGFGAGFEVEGTPSISLDATPARLDDCAVVVHQDEQAEDFHQFMAHFMDVLDGFYQVPEAHEIFQDAYTPSLAA